MKQNFQQAMTWLHAWFGLVLGFVPMGCFFFGALSVFDREIDRWAIPETRFAPHTAPAATAWRWWGRAFTSSPSRRCCSIGSPPTPT